MSTTASDLPGLCLFCPIAKNTRLRGKVGNEYHTSIFPPLGGCSINRRFRLDAFNFFLTIGLASLVWWASVSVSGGCCVVVGGGGRGAKPRVGGCALGVGRCVFRGLGTW